MCGRYTLTTPLEGIRQLFEVAVTSNLAPRYNIAPTQQVAAVRLGPDGRREVGFLRWGLIPAWAKDATIASRLINARGETLAEKPAFRQAFAQRRCLLPADGFYEWAKTGSGGKQPYYIHRRDGGLMAFAGLWESWRGPDDAIPMETCCIITTAATESLAPIHHRMPVILAREQHDLWLDPKTVRGDLGGLLRPCRDDILSAIPVSSRVNKVANDDAALISELAIVAEEPASPAQGSLF